MDPPIDAPPAKRERFCNGTCYVYTLSIREAMKAKKEGCTCEGEFIESPTSVSYWFKERDNTRWPKVFKTLKYERVYNGGAHSPYCIYALVHNTFVVASSLTDKDKTKFHVHSVQNDCIFTDYAKKLKDTKAEATTLQKQLFLHSVVSKYINDELSGFQSKVTDMLGNISQAISARSDTGAAVKAVNDVQGTINGFVTGFLRNTDPVLEVSEERQLYAWLDKLLCPILSSGGFEKIESYTDNNSVFGSSRPDLAFLNTV